MGWDDLQPHLLERTRAWRWSAQPTEYLGRVEFTPDGRPVIIEQRRPGSVRLVVGVTICDRFSGAGAPDGAPGSAQLSSALDAFSPVHSSPVL
jgi:hypothetical protein